MLITRQGVVLRTAVTGDSLREIGRATQGVRMMRVAEGDEVTSVVKIITEKEALDRAEAAEEEVAKEEAMTHADDVVKTLEEGGLEGHAKKVQEGKKPRKKKGGKGTGEEE
jgi:DNA gyrase/topoisomerase IV subunit A